MKQQRDPIRVFIVDDHQLVIDGISSLLAFEEGFEIAGTSCLPQEVPDILANKKVDVLLTDVQMPGMSGVELVRVVRSRYPAIFVLALSMHADIPVIKQMLDSGVSGYVLKNAGKAELLEAIRKVAVGDAHMSADITRGMMRALHGRNDSDGHLTNREIEIIRLIEKEMSTKEIADHLCLSEHTVETHRKNIFRKVGTQTVVGLLKYAYEHKII
jgi:DNA-binding NarL/FixJ family response regulator